MKDRRLTGTRQVVSHVTQTVEQSRHARDVDANGVQRSVVRWKLTLACGHLVERSFSFDTGMPVPIAPRTAICPCTSACTGKVSFDTYAMAARVRDARRKAGRQPYRCTFCHKYHLGRGHS